MAWWITDGVLQRAEDAPAENSIETDITGEGEVIIPAGVTSIGEGAFCDCPKLKRVVFPEGIRSIGDEAFAGCKALTEISLPKELETIGRRAFFFCSDLISAVIPEGVTMIREGTFSDCEKLTRVILPDSLRSLGYMAFRFCRNLKDIVLPRKIALLGGLVFYDCQNLAGIDLSENTAFIGRYAFGSGVRLKNKKMLRGMMPVGYSAFWNSDAPLIPVEVFNELHSAITDAGAMNEVRAISCPILPKNASANMRLKLCVGFAVNREKYSEEMNTEYLAHIKKNAAKLVKEAFDYPVLLRLMCAEKLIAAKNIDAFTEEAMKRENVELTALILNYQNSTLGMKEVSKARSRKEKIQEKQEETVIDRMAAREGKQGIDGLNFVVTGSLYHFDKRDDLKAYISEHGGKLMSAMSAKTDYLITNDTDSGSAKNQKAAQLGIEIITEVEFMTMAEKKQL